MNNPWLERIDRLNFWIGRIVSYLILGIIAITLWEIVWRYGFNRPTIWVHETSEHLFALSFLLGGGYTLSQGGHVRVDVIYNRFSPRSQAILNLSTFLFFFLFIGLLLWKGGEMAWESVSLLERSQSPWGPYIFHIILAVPLAAGLMLIQGIVIFLRDLKKISDVGPK